MDQQLWVPVHLQGLLEPDAVISRPSGSEGGAVQQCAAPTRQAGTAFFALKATLRGPSHVLRSHHPVGVNQEIYAYLITYQALRITASRAADTAGLDPDRLSFTVALRTLRNSVISTACHSGSVTAALLDPRHLHPPRRRARTSPRTVKRTLSPYELITRSC